MTSTVSWTALIRGLHLAATLSMLGTWTLDAWILPAASRVPVCLQQRLIWVSTISGSVAVVTGVFWFMLQAAAIAEADTLAAALSAIPLVAGQTRFGILLITRVALLLLATLLGIMVTHRAGLSRYAMIALISVAVALQGAFGHAGATEGTIGTGLVLSETMHLLAAGVWLGALLPFALALSAVSAADAAALCQRFSPIGLACVVVLAGTGLAQGLELIGTLPALVGTSYGHITLVKVACFLLAVALAAINRLWLTDRLSAGTADARQQLLMSVGLEAFCGLMIIVAAALLASTVPGVHDTPVWPMAWQSNPMIATLTGEGAVKGQLVARPLLFVAPVLLLVAARLRGRLRMAALIVAVMMIVWRGPFLAPLTIGSYPTGFKALSTGFAAASIARGHALFARTCAACHGSAGDGNGPLAAASRIKPANLTTPHLWEHSNDELFGWLTDGIRGGDGDLVMPGFATLPATDRWALVDYVRAHSANAAIGRDSMFHVSVPAPRLAVRCANIRARTMDDLHGYAVHVLMDADPEVQRPVEEHDGMAVVTLIIPSISAPDAKPASGSCVVEDPVAREAYSVLAALPGDKIGDAEFLVDPQGWLRAAHRPGDTGEWQSRNDLSAVIRKIRSHPIEQQGAGQHDHHH